MHQPPTDPTHKAPQINVDDAHLIRPSADVATGSRPQGGQVRRYMDNLNNSLKCLQINPTNWEELTRARPIDLEEDRKDKRSDLRSQPHHHCHSQTQVSQITTGPTSQPQRSNSPNLSTLPAEFSGTNRP
ncbi:hypothetical protein SprV_0702385000 [Sparganum proliferum]